MFIEILNKYFKPEGPSEIDRISQANEEIIKIVESGKNYVKKLRIDNEKLRNELDELTKKSKEKDDPNTKKS